MIFSLIYISLISVAFLISAYYSFLAIISFAYKEKINPPQGNPANTFAIVIPAHDEEDIISMTLRSCLEIDYPKDMFRIFVVADNCTDSTAVIARSFGAECLERNDDKNKGKGCALSWAFEKILPMGYDAFLVLDADCLIDNNSLKEFDKHIEDGHFVLQANDVTSNPDESFLSYVLGVGNVIENELFYVPKSILGLVVFLRGTGMVFHRKILEKYPWRARSITEDIEYTITLLRNDIHVKFIGNTRVLSKYPTTLEQVSIQRKRWATGNFDFGKTHALKLMKEGIFNRNVQLIDAGWTFLVLSRPLVLLELIISFITGILFFVINPGSRAVKYMTFLVIIAAAQVIYFLAGMMLLGLNLQRIKLLSKIPYALGKLMMISLQSVLKFDNKSWSKTPR
jgi:1,2-diacylglycerol 3-beta-glucosyltransferase